MIEVNCYTAVGLQGPFAKIMYQSIPSTNITPGVLHLLSAQVLGFLSSELSRGFPEGRAYFLVY